MQNSQLAICSHNPQFIKSIHPDLASHYEIKEFRTIADVSEWLHVNESCMLILDSCMLSGNTEFDRNILDSLLFQINHQLLIIIANYPCPSSFHQYLATSLSACADVNEPFV